MSTKITHLPPGLSHGTPTAKPDARAQSRAGGKSAPPARAGGRARASAQAPHSEDEVVHQDLHQDVHHEGHEARNHEPPAHSQQGALQDPAAPRGAKAPRGAAGVGLGQSRQGAGAASAGVQGRRAEQLKWAQMLQSVPQERLAAGQAVLKEHEAALQAFASKVALLRGGR